MAKAMEDLLALVCASISGFITVKQGHGQALRFVQVAEASHPVPDRRGMDAAEKILGIVDRADEQDLVIALFSGGGSALLPLPVEGISLTDMQETTDLLLGSGAEINEGCLESGFASSV